SATPPAGESPTPPTTSQIWLGSPNSIKNPTSVAFRRNSGSNLLIVGQNEEASLAMLALGLVALASQYPLGSARFFLLETNPPGSPQRQFLDRIISAIPHPIIQSRTSDLAQIMNDLAGDLERRTDDQQAATEPETFILVHGLQNFKRLLQEDEFIFSSEDSASGN